MTISETMKQCYEARELPAWGDILNAADEIDRLSRQLAEAQEWLNRLWVCMEKIDRTDPETVAWLETTQGMDLRNRRFHTHTAAMGTEK